MGGGYSRGQPRCQWRMVGDSAKSVIGRISNAKSWACGIVGCFSGHGAHIRLMAHESDPSRSSELSLYYTCGDFWTGDLRTVVGALRESELRWSPELCKACGSECF